MARCEPRRRRTAQQTAPQQCGMDGKHGGAARAPTHVLLCAGVPVPISVKVRLSTGTVSQAPAQATEPSKSAPRSAMQQAGRGAPTAYYGVRSVAATQQRSTARRTGAKANDSRHLARWRSWPRCDTAGTEPNGVVVLGHCESELTRRASSDRLGAESSPRRAPSAMLYAQCTRRLRSPHSRGIALLCALFSRHYTRATSGITSP